MNIEKRIQLCQICQNLTPIEMEIGSYILSHLSEIPDLTIQELSELIFVSKSAIHRFCKKLNYNGFNDLKVQIVKDAFGSYQNKSLINVNYPFQKDDSCESIAHKLIDLYELTVKETLEYMNFKDIEEIAHFIKDAKEVDMYTHSHNLNVAENFQDKMLTIGRVVNVPKTNYNQRLNVLKSDSTHVAFILSYSGKATFIKGIVKQLYEKNIPVILISSAGNKSCEPYITYHIPLSDKENLRDRISQFSSHIAMQYTLDVIYATLFRLEQQKNIRHIKEYIDYMDDRQLD